MGISITNQCQVFLFACLFGAVLGVFYDVFRIIRLAIPCNKIIILLQDIIFWLVCTFLTFAFMLITESGQIRVYIIFGELIGATLYYFTLGVFVMKSAKIIIRVIKKIIKTIIKIVILPFVKLWKIIMYPLLRFFKRKYKKTSRKFYRNAKYNIKKHKTALHGLIKAKK